MSKKLTEKMIEIGAVPPQAVEQMKAWKCISTDEITEGDKAHQDLNEAVKELAGILDEEDGEIPELRETIPGLAALFDTQSVKCAVAVPLSNRPAWLFNTEIVRGRAGSLIFKSTKCGMDAAQVGNQVTLFENRVFEIVEVSPLYLEDKVSFYMCNVQEVPTYAQVPEMRQFSQE